ncbi:MAG TPA: exodeoxyribonuclease V subunit gamma, partial [Waddliaceae bacterium]
MISQLEVFFSNQVEQLYPKLKDGLFSSLTTPFTKRMVIVPSPAMKIWLGVRFADDPDVGIATGFKISYLDMAIHELTKQFCLDPEGNCEVASHLEIAMLVESVIRQILSSEKIEILLKPLLDYLQASDLQDKEIKLSKKTNKRIVALSNKLATLFQQYEKYGCSMLQEWERSCNGGWQQEIWRRVIGKAPRNLTHWKTSDAQIHLFAVSFISQRQHDFFLSL